MSQPLIVLATGGTGGHIYPAVALAQELAKRGYSSAILGMDGGMEERIARQENLPFYGVSAGKIDRSKPNPMEVLKAARGFTEARAALMRIKPRVVVGFGGYASLPGVLSAQSLGIPTVLHEQNARLGLTQRLALGRAKSVTTAYPKVQGLPELRTKWVGMPVRERRMDRKEALSRLNLQEGPLTVLVMGGSQGSLFLNQSVPGALEGACGIEGLCGEDGIQVIHSTGPRWLTEMVPKVQHLSWYKVTGFVDSTAAWSCADIAITRAGSGTLAEAAFYGVPVIAVPLSSSADNHQLFNAKAVEQAGAGRLVEESAISKLGEVFKQTIAADQRKKMRDASATLTPAGATARLADEVLRIKGGQG